MKYRFLNKIITVLFLLTYRLAPAVTGCECPVTTLNLAECDKYEIIFRGKVVSVKDCGDRFGEAVFEVLELYKGNSTKQFTVLFRCNEPCYAGFTPGDEWIIYSRYKQLENVLMDWCSRSRKFFKIDKQDYYTVTYGNDYDDELKFLRDKLGLHRLLANNPNRSAQRNELPGTNQLIVILISSLLSIILFYYFFNKFFR